MRNGACRRVGATLIALGCSGAALAATFTVTNLNNSGAGSLRQAILDANLIPGADTIDFADNLSGTITLTTGVLSPGGSLVISGPRTARVEISGNDASRIFSVGVGVVLEVNDLHLRNGRSPAGTASFGGAIQVAGGTLTMRRSSVRDSLASATTAGGGGGIYVTAGGTLNMEDCLIAGNRVTANTGAWGGGAYAEIGAMTFTNCTFADNLPNASTVTYGGAIAAAVGAVTLEHCTLAGNRTAQSVGRYGSALSLTGATTGYLRNTLVAENLNAPNFDLQGGASLQSLGGNFDSDGSSGFSAATDDLVGAGGAPLDAKLGDLSDNGGPTPTMALAADSPAIDAGIVDAQGPARDQRGFDRAARGFCPGSDVPDIGAYEFNGGRGLNFDGVDDEVYVGNGSELDLTNVFTIEAWVRPDTLYSATGATRIFSRRGSSAGYGFGQSGGRLLFTTFGRRDYATTNAVLTPGEWTHVAVAFTAQNDARFFVNGQFVQMVMGTQPAAATTADAYIGRNKSTDDPQRWDGAIADLRVWSIVRTDSEIAQNHNRQLTGAEANLRLYYPLNEGAGVQVVEWVNQDQGSTAGSPAWITAPPCECGVGVRGDANCDGLVNFFDIDPFVLALFEDAAYTALFCEGAICTIDADCSGAINFFDIDPFVECLFGQCPPCE